MVYGRVKRALGRDSIVIVDGMNYIKGWRYQLWCDSKSMGTPSCVVCQYIASGFITVISLERSSLSRSGAWQILFN